MMEGEMQARDDDDLLAEVAAIWARFSALLTTLTQARTEIKDLRRFLEASGYDDQEYLVDLCICEIYLGAMKKKLARMSKVYEPEEGTREGNAPIEMKEKRALIGRNEHTTGAILRRLREERGWSLQELVKQIGRLYEQEYRKGCPLTISMIGKWERDEHIPTPTYRKLFCLLYQQTASQLGFLPLDGPDKHVDHQEPASEKGAIHMRIVHRISIQSNRSKILMLLVNGKDAHITHIDEAQEEVTIETEDESTTLSWEAYRQAAGYPNCFMVYYDKGLQDVAEFVQKPVHVMEETTFALFHTESSVLELALGPSHFALLDGLIQDRLDEVLSFSPPGDPEVVTLRVLSQGFQAALTASEVRFVPLLPVNDAQIELALALLNAQPSPPTRPSSVEKPTDRWMQLAAFLAAQGRPVVFESQQQRYICQPQPLEKHTDDPKAGG